MRVGERIREAREAADMTQRDLADLVGVDPMTISRFERGEHDPSIRRVMLIAEATGKDLSFFFNEAAA